MAYDKAFIGYPSPNMNPPLAQKKPVLVRTGFFCVSASIFRFVPLLCQVTEFLVVVGKQLLHLC
jgi:hypothetical protein